MRIKPDLNNTVHALIFEDYVRGIGMTPRMVTNADTGEHYKDGQTAADRLGVTRQCVNNCLRGRQRTVRGCHLVSSHEFRRALLSEFADICKRHGTNPTMVVDQFRALR